MSVQFKKRSGSTIRECNINIVIEMLKEGKSESDILTLLAMAFCSDTRVDYLNTAKEKLKMENDPATQQAQKQREENITKELEQKEQLTKAIEIELKANPKLKESDAVQKFATKDISEDLVSFCFDIAKNRILIEQQKNESATDYMKRKKAEKDAKA